jgi:hypothetical protein
MPLVVKREGRYLAHEHRDEWASAQLDAVWFKQTGRAQRAAARHKGAEVVRLSDAGGVVGGFATEPRESRAHEPFPVGDGSAPTGVALTLEDVLEPAPPDELEQTEAKLEDLAQRARVRAERQARVEQRARELREQLGITQVSTVSPPSSAQVRDPGAGTE